MKREFVLQRWGSKIKSYKPLYDLRLKGRTYQHIADLYGIWVATAWARVKKYQKYFV
jgi:hypothetical protein